MEGTLPPSCKNHGTNIGSVRYRRAEPDQTFDGPAAIYSATVATSRPVSMLRYDGGSGSRRYNGGSVPTS